LEHDCFDKVDHDPPAFPPRCNSSAKIGTPRLHAWTPCTTHNFSTSMISSIVAPSLSAALNHPLGFSLALAGGGRERKRRQEGGGQILKGELGRIIP
jgi:hypothetical protein